MQEITVGLGDRSYPIIIREGLLAEVGADLSERKIGKRYIIIADDHVATLFGDRLMDSLAKAGLACELITFARGEASKHLGTIADLASKLARKGVDRKDALIALGGGVTGDMTERQEPERDSRPSQPSISAFFPAYNDGGTIASMVIAVLLALQELTDDYEVIVVNDGSADYTAEILDELARCYERVRVVHHPQNRGYGGALRTGFASATKELIFYTDGDGQFDIAELPGLLDLTDKYDIITCYRINRRDSWMRKLNAWAWGSLVRWMFKLKIKDIDCAFKLYKRKIFDNIHMKSTGALIDAEILARASKKGYTIMQTGVRHYPRTAGTQTGANIAVVIRAFIELFKLFSEIRKEK